MFTLKAPDLGVHTSHTDLPAPVLQGRDYCIACAKCTKIRCDHTALMHPHILRRVQKPPSSANSCGACGQYGRPGLVCRS